MNNNVSNNTPLLQIKNISVQYQKDTVLKNCSVDLDESQNLVLLGASGCGKSTLLKAIAGLEPITEGKIILDGVTISSNDSFVEPAQRGVGMIFQDYALFPHLTCKENIIFGIHNLTKAEINKRLKETLELFELEEFANRYPHQLSGGQQQRVAIARSLICKPKVLLFDEPFSNLDTQIKSNLMLEIRKLLQQQNMTAIFVTHDKEEAFMMGDKIAMLDNGSIIQCDAPQLIYDYPIDINTAQFFGSVIKLKITQQTVENISTEIGTIDTSKLTHAPVITSDDNGDYINLRPHQLHIKPAKSNDKQDNQKTFTIIDYQFNGDMNNYKIRLKTQNIWLKEQERFNVGDSVVLTISQ